MGVLKRHLAAIEARWIRRALLKAGGSRTKAAKDLGLSIRMLHYKIKRYGITVPRRSRNTGEA